MISIAELPEQKAVVEMLRVCTAGSVDDGKSTLIGRLLYDCRAIPEDQYEAIRHATGPDEEATNLALLTDGLRAEREQQITIDVAYRYFASPLRRFILADTPGHAQYTRNMVTGASTAELAIVLVDARKGLLPQSRRHAIISSLLRVPRVLVAVNKMDLVDFDEAAFRRIETAFREFAANYSAQEIDVIPISALLGDNIVHASSRMPWYTGLALLDHLESVPIKGPEKGAFRFPVQCVIRPNQDFRGYAGQVVSGHVSVGEEIVVFPSRIPTTVTSIVTADGPLRMAQTGDAVVITLRDEVDISRGDLIAGIVDEPEESSQFEVDLCWLGDHPHRPGKHYVVLHGTAQCGAVLEEELLQVDIETLESKPTATLQRNDIAKGVITTFKPLPVDTYKANRKMGALLLVDPDTNVPAAAAMVAKISVADSCSRFEI